MWQWVILTILPLIDNVTISEKHCSCSNISSSECCVDSSKLWQIVMSRADRKSQVRQCLGFSAADFVSSISWRKMQTLPNLRLPISYGDVPHTWVPSAPCCWRRPSWGAAWWSSLWGRGTSGAAASTADPRATLLGRRLQAGSCRRGLVWSAVRQVEQNRIGLCQLLESESQESWFLPFFWRVARSDSFFMKSLLSNSITYSLSLIHAT